MKNFEKRNTPCIVSTQLRLFRPCFDPCEIPDLDGNARQGVNSEQIREHNRAAANQHKCAIKKHRATRLHYDLRLEFEGALLSWAIPEGPSYIADLRRMAIEMEDHDPAYISSERVIPKGMRGAGPMMQWDEGSWMPAQGYEDVKECLRKGRLKIALHCQKLNGIWMLSRRPLGRWARQRPLWDLIKEPDAFAREASAPDILIEAPDSVITGRTLEAIEQGTHHSGDKLTSRAQLFV